jgi:hypothetical protein
MSRQVNIASAFDELDIARSIPIWSLFPEQHRLF